MALHVDTYFMDHYVFLTRTHIDGSEAFKIIGHGEFSSYEQASAYLSENGEVFIPLCLEHPEVYIMNYDNMPLPMVRFTRRTIVEASVNGIPVG